jgi:hypothetical protein
VISGYAAGVGNWGRDEVFEYAGHFEGSSLASMLGHRIYLFDREFEIVLGKRATASAQELAVVP